MARGGVVTTKPGTRTLDWGAIVRSVWGDEWHKKEDVYIFSNGRRFKDSGDQGGPYTGTTAG